MTNFPTLPDFLDRRLNGVTTDPADYTARRISSRRRKKVQHKVPQGAVRVFFRNRHQGVSAGWHYVEIVSIGPKHARIKPLGKTRCIRLPRTVWDQIQKDAA